MPFVPHLHAQVAVFFSLAAAAVASVEHVIVVSVDGLRPATIQELGAEELPNFHRFRQEGAWTDNARTDYDSTFTVPNHVSMVTGRPVQGPTGHGYVFNGTPSSVDTLHRYKGSYLASLFDVAHERGLSTSLFVNKPKLVIIDQSYESIDTYYYSSGPSPDLGEPVLGEFLTEMQAKHFNLAFVHFADPDQQGHGDRWETDAYQDAVRRVDDYLGGIFELIEVDPELNGKTVLILTADHGGIGAVHEDQTNPGNYTIPFYAWGPGVAEGVDLYSVNMTTRSDPGATRPDYTAAPQPIRNGDVANLALDLLGLPAVPGSTINDRQDLAVTNLHPPMNVEITRSTTGMITLNWTSIPDGRYTVEVTENLAEASWNPAPGGPWPIDGSTWSTEPSEGALFFRVKAE